MSTLVLILTDFFGAPPAEEAAASPRLPALELLLARARRLPREPWRDWLAGRLGVARVTAPAALAAERAGITVGAQRRAWFATPLHYVAGMDGIRVHRHGLLALSELEQGRLVQDFERVFAGSGWQLHAIGARELLLLGPELAADGADPARLAGADPSGGLPSGAAAGTLRRLASEMEMWLHEHPVNRERSARGELAVNALWPWGSSLRPMPSSSSSPAPLRVYGTDTVARALLAGLRAATSPLPARLAEIESAGEDVAVLLPLLGKAGQDEPLLSLERDWFAPALQGLRERRLAGLQLRFDDRALSLKAVQLLQLWRRPRPWREALP